MRRFAAMAAIVAACAACAQVPVGGRVVPISAGQGGVSQEQPYVRSFPVPPDPKWDPVELVQGFLTAAGSFDKDHYTARLYLQPGVSWLPVTPPKVFVTDDQPAPAGTDRAADGATIVHVQVTQVGVINNQGQYQAQQKTIIEDFRLGQNAKGEWRITGLPADLVSGILLSQQDRDRAFQMRNLYFFAPDRNVLVPNPVFLPITSRADLPGQIVRALLAGAGDWLSPAVVNDFPPNTKLLGNKVDVSADGTATVNLSGEASSGDRAGMSAQLAWAFKRSVPEIKHLRLQINGVTVVPNATVGPVQPINNTWDAYGPDAAIHASAGYQAFVVDKNGHLAAFSANDGRPPQPIASLANVRVNRPAISIDRTRAAWLSSRGDVLYTGNFSSPASVKLVLQARPGATFTQPSWDRYGNLWTVESTDNQSWLWVQQPGHDPVQSDIWDKSGFKVLAFRVALDGVRVAAIVSNNGKGEIQLGRITRDSNAQPSVGPFLPISTFTSVADAVDLAWRGADDLAVLGKATGGVQPPPYDVPVSGGQGYAIGTATPAGLATIAAGPYPVPVLVGVQSQEAGGPSLCWLRDSRGDQLSSDWWCPQPGVTTPVYPG